MISFVADVGAAIVKSQSHIILRAVLRGTVAMGSLKFPGVF